jgi:hypothetical protein
MTALQHRYFNQAGGRGDQVIRRRWSIYALIFVVAVLLPWLLPAGCTPRPLADSTAELQSQLDAMQPGGYLTLSPQVYEHQGVLKMRVPDVHIDGAGATLRATNDATSAVQILADGVQLSNVNLAAGTEGERFSGKDQHKLVISGRGVNIAHVSINGSAGAGIFVDGATNFRIDDVTVTGSRADGIHITGGSSGGVIQNVSTSQTGDDGLAVVSYKSDRAACSDIQISGVKVAGTRWGRGISVVGGRNIFIRGFDVSNTDSAGIYLATEGSPYFTDSVDSVTVSSGSITGANTNPEIAQGALLVVASNPGTSVQNVTITDVSIASTPSSAGRDIGLLPKAGTVQGISLNNIRIGDSSLKPLDSDAPPGSYSTSGWTVAGKPVNPS